MIPSKVRLGARVNTSFISINDYYKDLDSYKQYYEVSEEQDFNSEEGKKAFESLREDLLNLLIEDEIIAKEAKKYNLSVDDKEVEERYSELAQRLGDTSGGSLEKHMKDFFNWNTKTFKEKIKLTLMREKMTSAIARDTELNRERRQKADEVLAKVKSNDNFGEIAKEFSEDPSAADSGNIGWVGRGSFPKEYEDAAFGLEKGQVSDIVTTDAGFYIIKVNDKRKDEVNISHILIKPMELAEWLQNKKEEYKVQRFISVEKIKS